MMSCRSIADVLRGLGEAPPSDMAIVEEARPEPPVACGEPWINPNWIAASHARDVLERRDDDRSLAWRREMGARFAAVARLSRPPKFKFGAQVKAKVARPKVERTAEEKARHREYMRAYMRESRARQKADASGFVRAPESLTSP